MGFNSAFKGLNTAKIVVQNRETEMRTCECTIIKV